MGYNKETTEERKENAFTSSLDKKLTLTSYCVILQHYPAYSHLHVYQLINQFCEPLKREEDAERMVNYCYKSFDNKTQILSMLFQIGY